MGPHLSLKRSISRAEDGKKRQEKWRDARKKVANLDLLLPYLDSDKRSCHIDSRELLPTYFSLHDWIEVSGYNGLLIWNHIIIL